LKDCGIGEHILKKLIIQFGDWFLGNDKKMNVHWSHINWSTELHLEILMREWPERLLVYRYPDMRFLCHKDVFGSMMELCKELAPECYDFIPATYNLSNKRELERFKAY
jgi:hypothetical protein